MTNRLLIGLLTAMTLALASCNYFKQIIGEDPEPPEGYAPVFITSEKPFNPNENAKRILELSRTDPYKSDKVRLYMHLIQSDTVFLTNAADKDNKQYWCEVVDEANGESYKIKDFTIRQSSSFDRRPQSIALVMDMSGSMGNMRAKAVQNAAYNFIRNTKGDKDKVALVMYDDSVGVECGLTDSKNTLIDNLRTNGLGTYGGMTATLDAVSVGLNEVMKSNDDYDRVIMVFTDGQDNESKLSKDEVVQQARRANAMVCTIDYGYMIQEQFLEDIAEKTNGTYNHIYQSQEFDLVFQDIYHRLDDYYIMEYEPPTFGAHTVTVKLCMPAETLEVKGKYNNVPYAGMTKLIDVYFDTGKSELKPESEKSLKLVYDMLYAKPSIIIEVQGHTDSQGDEGKNQVLSEDRANAVREALINKGIAGNRIIAKGFGESQPIADNNTADGRAKNRRTVFVVISD